MPVKILFACSIALGNQTPLILTKQLTKVKLYIQSEAVHLKYAITFYLDTFARQV